MAYPDFIKDEERLNAEYEEVSNLDSLNNIKSCPR